MLELYGVYRLPPECLILNKCLDFLYSLSLYVDAAAAEETEMEIRIGKSKCPETDDILEKEGRGKGRRMINRRKRSQ